MNIVWTKGLDTRKADEVRIEYASSPILRARLTKILNDKNDLTVRQERSKEALDNPNWALKQAYQMGYEKAIEEILNLFSD